MEVPKTMNIEVVDVHRCLYQIPIWLLLCSSLAVFITIQFVWAVACSVLPSIRFLQFTAADYSCFCARVWSENRFTGMCAKLPKRARAVSVDRPLAGLFMCHWMLHFRQNIPWIPDLLNFRRRMTCNGNQNQVRGVRNTKRTLQLVAPIFVIELRRVCAGSGFACSLACRTSQAAGAWRHVLRRTMGGWRFAPPSSVAVNEKRGPFQIPATPSCGLQGREHCAKQCKGLCDPDNNSAPSLSGSCL